MDAIVMNMQPQTAGTGAGQQTAAANRMPAAENKGAFVRLLQQMTGSGSGAQQTAQVSGDTHAALSSGAMSMQMLAVLLAEEAGTTELAALVGKLLAQLQADGARAEELMEDPAFADWLAEAAVLIGLVPARQGEAEPQLIREGQLTAADAEALLARLYSRLASGQPDAQTIQAASNLRAAMQQLADSVTAGTTPEQATPKAAASSAHPVVQTAQPNPVQGRETGLTPFRGVETAQPAVQTAEQLPAASSRQLLDRLAHMRPNVVIVAEQSAETAESLTMAVKTGETPAVTAQAASAEEVPHAATPAVPNQTVPVKPLDAPVQQADVRTAVLNARQFAEDMADWMVKQFTVTRAGALSEAKITLVPEHLGQLDVKISVQNGTVTAVFAAETAGAREMLEYQLPMLRVALQQQGFQVERLIVSQQTAGPGTGSFQEERQRHAGEQERKQGGTREAVTETESFDYLPDLDASYGGESALRYGSTFHATA